MVAPRPCVRVAYQAGRSKRGRSKRKDVVQLLRRESRQQHGAHAFLDQGAGESADEWAAQGTTVERVGANTRLWYHIHAFA